MKEMNHLPQWGPQKGFPTFTAHKQGKCHRCTMDTLGHKEGSSICQMPRWDQDAPWAREVHAEKARVWIGPAYARKYRCFRILGPARGRERLDGGQGPRNRVLCFPHIPEGLYTVAQ